MSEFHECVVGTFDKELQALIDYGHDCCARIDDRINECCQRIREAHDVEVGSYQIALTWMYAAPLPQYDVLGNERHKAVCKLREMPDGYPRYSAYPFAKWYEDLSTALGIDKGERSCAKVRDTLIHLLGGDAMEVKDGVDAGRCGETNAGDRVPAADKRRADCDDNQPSEEVASITTELREWWVRKFPVMDKELHEDFTAIADRIDAEYEEAIQQALMGDGGVPATDENMAEHGWYRALDADKQPIKFDDEVEHNGVVAKVLGITFHGTTPPTVCIVRGDYWVEADELRHHHAPTVEDLLFSYGQSCICISNEAETDAAKQTMLAKLREEYAAKLRLAEDANA